MEIIMVYQETNESVNFAPQIPLKVNIVFISMHHVQTIEIKIPKYSRSFASILLLKVLMTSTSKKVCKIPHIIIHTELLVAKIKSCIPKLCDKEGNIFLILPGQYFFNIARTLCDQSFPRIALCPAHLSYCCYVPQAFAFVR